MAKKPSITTVASGYQSTTTINNNLQNLRDAFDNTLSRDGSSPNEMLADLDMNSNDILNVNSISADVLIIDNVNLNTIVQETASYAAASAASANASAASYDSFDDRYLGAKATEPALDNDGNALLTGAIYWNTVSAQMFVWSGSAWINYESASAASAATATTQAGIATTQATTATTQAGIATTQAGIATTQAGLAASARDAAFINANVYADTAAGLAAVALNDQFQVVSGTEVIRYREDAGPVATEVARYPSADNVKLLSVWVDPPATSLSTVGSVTPTGTPYNSTRYVGPAAGLPVDGIVRSLTVVVTTAPLAAQIILMKPRRQLGAAFQFEVISTTSVSGLAVGTHTIDLGSISAPAGTRVLLRRSTGAIDGDATTAGSCEHNSATATIGEVKDLSLAINRALAMQLNYIALPVRTLSKNALKSGFINSTGGDQREDISSQAGSLAISSSLAQRLEIAADVGIDIPVGSVLVGVKASLQISSAANKAMDYVLAIYRRATSDANVDASTNTGTLEYLTSRLFTGSSLGLVDGAAVKDVLFSLDSLTLETGYTYYASLSGIAANGGFGQIGYSVDYARSSLRQRRRGWTVSGTTVTSVTTFGAEVIPVSLRMGLVFQEPVSVTLAENTPTPTYIDKITDASFTTSGFDLTTRIKYSRDNTYFDHDDQRTITAAAAGQTRFDILYLDRSLVLDFTERPTFGLAAGTERTTDAPEFIPTVKASLQGHQTPIAYLRVTNSTLTVLPSWDAVNDDLEHLVPQIRLDRERNQRLLRSALGRIYRAGPIKIAGIGDSIMALGNVGTVAGYAAANGTARDIGRTQYYNTNIGSDLVTALPLFTSVQLGRPDDGGGSIHTKTGFIWTFVGAIQKLTNLALGTAGILYNNWGINSQRWQNLHNAGVASSWLINFCADGADLVIINMGMNDYNTSVTFYTNAVNAIQYMQANMVDRNGNPPPIIIMGIARPNNSITQNFWTAANRRVRAVAEETNCAYVDLNPWYDNPNLRAIGMTGADTCTANGTNHPGIYEQEQVMGRALIQAVLG